MNGETLKTRPMPSMNRALRRRFHALLKRRDGIAAVEFALVLPIMVAMYFGLVELTAGFGHDARAARLAQALSDMVTQSTAINHTDMNTIFMSATTVLQPYQATGVAMRVTSYVIDRNGNAFVDWSDVRNISPKTPFGPRPRCFNANAILPAWLRLPQTSVVYSEVAFVYQPVIGQFVAPTGLEMKSSHPTSPRGGTPVGREGTPATNCPGYAP
ncbi:MAG TPA: pilus assembly protein [Beijerinckiaceae bacterium]|nr:pilus assembly protein [Beijerinckiaceae bacterium]